MDLRFTAELSADNLMLDQDWFVVTLDANEGLEVEINYSPSFTSPINGTVYNNEFDLAIYDSNSNQIDYSYLNNPEIVTTNTSVLPHGGTIYVQIIRYAGYGSYDLELWTWITQSGGGGTSNQNDLGIPNFDLPDSYTLLQSSGLNPYNLNGAAPYYSGTLSAEFDASGDNEDWFAVTLNTNEWFGIEINYNPFTVINGTGYANQFELEIFDVFGTQINQSFLGTGTAYVSTNNSAPGASIHQGLVYIRMYSLQGFGQYDVEVDMDI